MEDRIHRHPDRASDQVTDLRRLLDDQMWGVLSTISEGLPFAVPILHARDGDRLLIHGSTGAGALRHVAEGAPIVYSVTAMDALVIGFTTFDSSANYRSATLRGTLRPVTGEDKAAALDVLAESIIPGRAAEVRPMTRRELASTSVLELPITGGSWIYKARRGQASTPDEPTDAWGGVVPLVTMPGKPERAEWSTATTPASVRHMPDSLRITRGQRSVSGS